jgi:26S proteasome regulatory subunit N2
VIPQLHQAQTPVDYLGLTRCLEALGDAASTADILVQLLKAGAAEEEAEASAGGAAAASAAGAAASPARATAEEAHLMALQIAFDMADSDNQKFLAGVGSSLPKSGSTSDDRAAAIAVASAAAISGDGPAYGDLPAPSNSFWERLTAVHEVLRRDVSLRLQIHFLFKACNADRAILKQLRTAQSRARYDPVAHHALVASAALMHAGTTLDFFYRDNIQWIRQATNWARFSAIASVGVYHKGNVENAMRVLKPMLPNPAEPTQSNSVAGGSLYALGLIHANRGAIEGDEALPFLVNHLSHHDEIVRHGACLGVGLAAMGSCNELAFAEMTNVLFQPSAIGQEAAGLGMGLMLVGNGTSFSSPLTDGMPVVLWLLTHATSTQHEKAVRGITMGIAMSCFGLEEAADVIIEQMSRDGDPIVRYGAQFTRALAYCGSADSRIVRDLLHAAVSDVSDDVRRASVMALGFVLHRKPQDLPHLVGLLAESFNPHVRYGAAMALGIAAAATGMPSALHILKPLLDDPTDFVRQGAFMATAMVLQEESEARTPMVKSFRERVMADACDKYKPPMARMGAIMAAGILDAGGRNCVVSLTTPAGFTKPTAVIGMALFTQYWYWFPLVHCLSLATNPTALVAVAPVKGKPGEFRLPTSFGLDCRCKPALFAYPDMLSDKPEEKKATAKKVELSTASRSKARSRQRQLHRLRSQRSDGSKISRGASRRTAAGAAAGAASSSSSDVAAAASGATDSPMSPSGSASTAVGASAVAALPDATRFMVANASRVAPPQRKFLRVPETARWVPVRKDVTSTMGILVVGDSEHRSGSAAVDETDGDLEEIKRPRIGEDAKEPAAPAAFTFTPSDTEWADAALADETAAT